MNVHFEKQNNQNFNRHSTVKTTVDSTCSMTASQAGKRYEVHTNSGSLRSISQSLVRNQRHTHSRESSNSRSNASGSQILMSDGKGMLDKTQIEARETINVENTVDRTRTKLEKKASNRMTLIKQGNIGSKER